MSGQQDHEKAKGKAAKRREAQEKPAGPRLSAEAASFDPSKAHPQANTFTPGRRPSSAPGQASGGPADFTPGRVPRRLVDFTPAPGQLTPGQHHQLGFSPYPHGLALQAPFYPVESPGYPMGPLEPIPLGDEEPNYNLHGREIAPGLTVGYAAVSPEQMQAWVKGKTHAAAITIIDGRVDDNEPILGNTTNRLKHQSQPCETPQPNFLSIVIRKSTVVLTYKLKDICDFIDRYYTDPPSLAEQQEAARGFDEDDDEIFLGPELLGKKGKDLENYKARHMRPASVVMIHGGQTPGTRYEPTFIGIAYLMRKWRLGVKETLDRARRFDDKWAADPLSLTDMQIEGLEVWNKVEYDIWDRAHEFKPPYEEYVARHNAAQEKPNQHDLPASG
ncbi:hypothetical protein QBC37DRAFT_373499 [Rhypophila decipiens]|uniref:Uncharacterized protein n=1 Tax=Rhypophila decipiens TaxID=261697 RepID=A0AAN6Y7A8_9PEZI|nr:hypothetical protein QBC37DRAFT_373499 [Rhypophila decipiens]